MPLLSSPWNREYPAAKALRNIGMHNQVNVFHQTLVKASHKELRSALGALTIKWPDIGRDTRKSDIRRAEALLKVVGLACWAHLELPHGLTDAELDNVRRRVSLLCKAARKSNGAIFFPLNSGRSADLLERHFGMRFSEADACMQFRQYAVCVAEDVNSPVGLRLLASTVCGRLELLASVHAGPLSEILPRWKELLTLACYYDLGLYNPMQVIAARQLYSAGAGT